MNKNQYLFVYGTLMSNHSNPYAKLILNNSKHIGIGFIFAKKYNLGAYPGVKLDPFKTNKTVGELYQIQTNIDTIFKELDHYEDYQPHNESKSLFIRKKALVYTENNNSMETWVYEYAPQIN